MISTDVIKKVFLYAGIALASITAYELVTGDYINTVVFNSGNEIYIGMWDNATYGNGTRLNGGGKDASGTVVGTTEKAWEKLEGKVGKVEITANEDWVNRNLE